MSHENKRPVTVEDLLRLKRNEQPSAEFWAGFDRQLRAKQLTALVEKRPWWQRIQLRPATLAWRRYHLPLGAVAALALTVVAVRTYDFSAPQAPTVSVNSPVASVATPPPAALPAAENLVGHESSSPAVAVVADEPSPAALPALGQANEPANVVAALDVAPVTPLLGIETAVPLLKEDAPPVAEFAAVPVIGSVITGGLLATAVAPPAEEQVARSRASRVEPLTRVVVSSEAQGRGRLNALAIAMLTTKLPQGPAEDVTARHASSLSTDRVYERPKGRVSSASGNAGFALNVGL